MSQNQSQSPTPEEIDAARRVLLAAQEHVTRGEFVVVCRDLGAVEYLAEAAHDRACGVHASLSEVSDRLDGLEVRVGGVEGRRPMPAPKPPAPPNTRALWVAVGGLSLAQVLFGFALLLP